VIQFSNTMYRKTITKLEGDLKVADLENLTLKTSMKALEDEVKELKTKKEESSGTKRPTLKKSPSLLEKFMEELRENLAHETKEKERWKRYYVEAAQELEESKKDREKILARQIASEKEIKLLETEITEQTAFHERAKLANDLVRQRLEAQLEDLQKRLMSASGANVPVVPPVAFAVPSMVPVVSKSNSLEKIEVPASVVITAENEAITKTKVQIAIKQQEERIRKLELQMKEQEERQKNYQERRTVSFSQRSSKKLP